MSVVGKYSAGGHINDGGMVSFLMSGHTLYTVIPVHQTGDLRESDVLNVCLQ